MQSSQPEKSYQTNGDVTRIDVAEGSVIPPPPEGKLLYGETFNAPNAEKFVVSGYKDVWCAVFFYLSIAATIGIGGYNAHRIHVSDGSVRMSPEETHFAERLARYVAVTVSISVVGVCLSLATMRAFPAGYIIAANVLAILINAAVCGLFIYWKLIWPAVIFGLCALFHAIWFYLVRRRIPFAAALLSTSTRTVTRHHGTIVTSLVSIVVFGLYLVFFALMTFPTFTAVNNSNSNCDNGANGGSTYCTMTAGKAAIVAVFLLGFYWTSQVVINVVHVTASGTVATYYFLGDQNMPPNPSVASLRRATTTSFGSICFGSLIVAILKLIHTMLNNARNNPSGSPFLACIAACLIGFIEYLMERFNIYALCYVAIYGYGYVEAAKATWRMVKKALFSAVFNDALVFPVLTITTFCSGVALGVIVGYIADSVIIGIVCGIICFVIFILVLRVVYSGIVTLFICYLESPETLTVVNPELATLFKAAQDVYKKRRANQNAKKGKKNAARANAERQPLV